MNKTQTNGMARLTLALIGMSGGYVMAQDLVLEEIIVTAERRSESIQDVAGSLSALQEGAIRTLGIRSAEDLQKFVPNLSIKSQSIGTVQYNIRGVGQTVDDITVESGVGVFIDDIYVPRMGPGNATLFDLERIEVLRGPQGTLYGRNTAGGSINFITKKPSDEFEGQFGIEAGNLGHLSAKAYLSGPISGDTVFGKISAVTTSRDGYVTNTNTGNKSNEVDTTAVRVGLRFGADDRTQFSFTADYEDTATSGRFFNVGPEGGFTSIVQPLLDAFNPGAVTPVPATGFYETNIDSEGFERMETWGVMGRVDIPSNKMTTSLIAGYRSAETAFLADRDMTTLNLLDEEHAEDTDWGSVELRFTSNADTDSDSRFDWTAGAYYFFEDGDRAVEFTNDELLTYLIGFPPGSFQSLGFTQAIDTTAYAIFGEGSYRFNDRFSATAGLRYTDEEKTADIETLQTLGPGVFLPPPFDEFLGPGPFNPLFDAIYSASNTKSWSDVTGKISLEFDVADDTLLYALYSQGFKSGGYQGTPRNLAAAATAFEPETLDNFELGVKSEFANGRMRINGSIFSMDYKDLQSGLIVAGGTPVTANADAKIDGFEIEIVGLVSENLQLTGSYGYIDSKYTSYEAEPARVGQQVNGVPENKYAVMFDYGIPSGAGETLIHLDYVHEDDTTGPLGGVAFAAYEVLNARVTFSPGSDRWEIAAWVQNALDEEYWSNVGLGGSPSDPFSLPRLPALPRTYGVTFTYNVGR